MEQQSLLIGKRVLFSKSREVSLQGRVLDKVNMVQKPEDLVSVTGYLIQTDDGIIHSNIAYWRLQSIIEE